MPIVVAIWSKANAVIALRACMFVCSVDCVLIYRITPVINITIYKGKDKVIPSQARCVPEGG